MPRLLACLAVAGAADPAVACINDGELPSHEREFRSQYSIPDILPAPSSPGERVAHVAVYSSGAVLLVGAVGMAVTRRRAGV